MELTINIATAIALTTVTGSILFLFWYFVGSILEKIGFTNLRHMFLKVVLIFYLFPLAYIIIKIYTIIEPVHDARIFGKTPVIGVTSMVIVALWAVFAAILSCISIHGCINMSRRLKESFPCDELVEDIFNRVARQMDIDPDEVMLVRNYSVVTPLITGFVTATVILPVRNYSEEELQVIFMHELTHYKHNDLVLKHLMTIVNIIHFFNPLVWWLNDMLQKWCEYTCDWEVYRKVGVKHYFDILLSMACDVKNTNFVTHLVEKKSELEERVEHMMKYYKVRKYPKIVAALLVMCISLTSSATVFAAVDTAKNAYFNLFDKTLVEQRLEMEGSDLELHCESVSDWNLPVVTGSDSSFTRTLKTFNWNVSANSIVQTTSTFYVAQNDSIVVSIDCTPSNLDIDYGIVLPSGIVYYVTDCGKSSYTFTAPTSGNYRVFVRNYNDQTVNVEGSYIY